MVLKSRPRFFAAVSIALTSAMPWTTVHAGDILRGGATGNTPGKRAAGANPNAGTDAARAAQVKAADRLARTTKAVQDMRALQSAARAAARASSVPEGLRPGGLERLTGANARWSGAAAPVQSGKEVRIVQSKPQAVLHWKTFNVGKETTVNFDQSAGGRDASKWIAFNKVYDPAARPSRIEGSLRADGQIYVINQNGIIFGAGSQVNARALVASALPLNDNLVDRGLLNNPDAQFLFSGFDIAGGSKGPTPAFQAPAATLPDGSFGDVVVERGAVIDSPTTAEKVGGRVLLVGANVRNEGTIRTPDGQTILAAGLQVGFAAHSTADPTLRGLDVYVGSVDYASGGLQPRAGTATNTGLVEAARGSVTIAGRTVRQLGVVESSTTTALNGRVDLLANYGAVPNANHDFTKPDTSPLFFSRQTGLVEMGGLIRILPEVAATDKAVGTQLALPSIVNVQGRAIHMGVDAILQAPGASLPTGSNAVIPRDGSRSESRGLLDAGVTFRAGEWIAAGTGTLWASSTGQVYIDRGALVDVSGTTGVLVPLDQSFLTIQLRGAELADSPLQRTGPVRGQSLTVDARRNGEWNGRYWIGTPLGDVSGYVGILQRGVGELTTAGGTVSITAGESVVLRSGSVVDVSGGTKIHSGGTIRTTRLLRGGNLVNIDKATPDQTYDGIYTGVSTRAHAKWGVSRTYRAALAPLGSATQQETIEGADAGSLAITAAAVALDGTLLGQAVQGPRQVSESVFNPARAGALSIRFQAADPVAPTFALSPTPPSIRFDPASSLPAPGEFLANDNGIPSALSAERKRDVILPPGWLTEGGFGTLLVDNSDGDITVPSGVPLELLPQGSLTLRAANLHIDSPITSPGGTLDFTVSTISPFWVTRNLAATIKQPTPAPDPLRGLFALGGSATLDVRGVVVDNRFRGADLPPVVDGGRISIKGFLARLNPNAVLDVSGGVAVQADGSRQTGSAGAITIEGGRDPGITWVTGGGLELGASLRGYSVAGASRGGSLSLLAPRVQVGGVPEPAETARRGEVLYISPDFFQSGGFSDFSLTGLGRAIDAANGDYLPAVEIAPGTSIRATVDTLVASSSPDGIRLTPRLLPEGERPSARLSFLAPVAQDLFSDPVRTTLRGDVLLGAGTRIETDASGRVTLRGGTVTVLGEVVAPGGQITVTGAERFPLLVPSTPGPGEDVARSTVYLGSGSLLSAAGKFVPTIDPLARQAGDARRLGTVVDGGTILVDGNIVAPAGARLDVSGTSAVLDVHPDDLASTLASSPVRASSGLTSRPDALRTVPVVVESNGGTISLTGRQMLFSDASLRGFAGGTSSSGGRLLVTSGRYISPTNPISAITDINLTVRQSGRVLTTDPGGVGQRVAVGGGDRGIFSVERFLEGGFDSLALSGTVGGAVAFQGDVNLSARRSLRVAEGGVLFADADVLLEAPYVALGTAFQAPVQLATSQTDNLSLPGKTYLLPSSGTGRLTVKASLIDIGNLSLQNIGLAEFLAPSGDVRGNGALNIAGTARIQAGQIYPTTGSLFTIVAFDPAGQAGAGTIQIQSGSQRPLPYSAGGTLSLYASRIIQSGTVRAPFGTINIGWDGTGTTPKDYLSGAGLTAGRSVPVTRELVLGDGSVTSTSGVDPSSGQRLVLPYGINPTEQTWMDPSGLDITGTGAPSGTVNLAALSLASSAGAVVDIRGGGDLFAFRWIAGNGGSADILAGGAADWSAASSYTAGQTVSYGGSLWSARRASNGVAPTVGLDWTRLPQSYAVVPGYAFDYAPYAPFNAGVADPGYVNTSLSVGDRIRIGPGAGLAAGDYTLLPARYALLPGASLVSVSSDAGRSPARPDGSTIVSGYRFRTQGSSDVRPATAGSFEVLGSAQIGERAEYGQAFANTFFPEAAARLGLTANRVPADAGHVRVTGLNALRFEGFIAAGSPVGGLAGRVDLATRAGIVIGTSGTPVAAGSSFLDATRLSSYGAGSLLVGGLRASTGGTVNVLTSSLTVSNAGAPLTAGEVLLVSTGLLELSPGAQVNSNGARTDTAEGAIRIGDSSSSGSGNGLLLRVGSAPRGLVRAGVSSQSAQSGLANPPRLIVGAGSQVLGDAVTLDSTYAAEIDPLAIVATDDLALGAGRVRLVLGSGVPTSPATVLELSGSALARAASATNLAVRSYSSIDFAGSGDLTVRGSLSLSAGTLRNIDGGNARLSAGEILLSNSGSATADGAAASSAGRLSVEAGTIRLGLGAVLVDGFAETRLQASGGVLAEADGSLTAEGALDVVAPLVTASKASYSITSDSALRLTSPGSTATVTPGLGASLTLRGATVSLDTSIRLPSGSLSVRSTSGALDVGTSGAALLDVRGTRQVFQDLIRLTSAGRIELTSNNGQVSLGSGSRLLVSGHASGGDAGELVISSANGDFSPGGLLDGSAASGWRTGSFALDVKSLADLGSLDSLLNASAFTQSRAYRIRTGSTTVSTLAKAASYLVAADRGSIAVGSAGGIDASGATGGDVRLVAARDLVLESGSRITVAAADFNTAGKGGKITLEAGAAINGVSDLTAFADLRAGAILDLSVATSSAANEALGRFSGKLHVRAPQTAAATGLNVRPLDATITGASSILVEGFRILDLTGTGVITSTVQTNIRNNGNTFGANIAAIQTALLANNAALAPLVVVAPGAEVINRTGSLTLGTSTSTTTSDWNLSGFRFGPKSAPGVLTLRARDNLVFFNALSDGFTPTLTNTDGRWLYTATLSAPNALLPVNTQSWSYRLTAGADFTGADFRAVRPLDTLAATAGSLQLGKLVTTNNGIPIAAGGANAQTSTAIGNNRYQVIRTGSGDIAISAARDIQFLNQFSTIYTAGTRLADFTLGGLFEAPPVSFIGTQGPLGAVQQNPTYAAQYSFAGGDVSLFAQRDIARYTQSGGVLVADSQKQIPNNWLYRRGYVDAATGRFGVTRDGDIASTTWWVDFSNFFQGVGALGGGNVRLQAGRDVANVDAVVPTNARMTYRTASGDLLAENQSLVELGGGDLTVSAGRNIDAGIYYVERGRGDFTAGGSVVTNSTRLAALGDIDSSLNAGAASTQWLPTTLFAGKAGFRVRASGDILLGPTVNPFLLPVGINNSFWRKSYFSTYAPDTSLDVTSLGGSIKLRQNSALPGSEADQPILRNWMAAHVLTTNPRSLALLQPWLRLAETQVNPFSTVFTLLPGTLRASALGGDINLSGRFNLSPAATGTIELVSTGSIQGLQPRGRVTETATGGVPLTVWSSATINLSDADPDSIPGVNTPYGYQTRVGTTAANAARTANAFLQFIDNLFAESGSSTGAQAVIQTQQALHGTSLLRAADTEPARLYATGGSISGFQFFSGKFARIVASEDITDIGLYLQNTRSSDLTVVSSGRDIVAYNANSPQRVLARSTGNRLSADQSPLSGDIQINGPGALAVLAGRNLDLGLGENNADGTGVGLTSIGNARNPNLPFDGADIIAAAGVGTAALLSDALTFDTFVKRFIKGTGGAERLAEVSSNNSGLPAGLTPELFETLSPELRARVALEVFFLVLRDSGRAGTASEGEAYVEGFEAIDALFGTSSGTGDITTRSRDIRTRSGGAIQLLAPGGSLQLATSTIGNPLTPPGVVTESGGGISIFTLGNVDIGISRIFTLRGGDQVIWSSEGDIAAGSSSKTVQSAPPTRVLIDPQSAALNVDLGGLATGGGIGVLASVEGVEPGSVDLIAPRGVVDAGDAGIRATGDLNIAATSVLNADNISTGGTTTGVPTAPPVAAVNIGGLTAGSTTTGAATAAAENVAAQSRGSLDAAPETPSIITVEVLGYGGSDEG